MMLSASTSDELMFTTFTNLFLSTLYFAFGFRMMSSGSLRVEVMIA